MGIVSWFYSVNTLMTLESRSCDWTQMKLYTSRAGPETRPGRAGNPPGMSGQLSFASYNCGQFLSMANDS